MRKKQINLMNTKRPRITDLVLKNAKIVVDHQIFRGGIAINEGKIVTISKEARLPLGDVTRDLRGQLIIPGVIDIHTHLRDLDYAEKEDFFTGTCAAANGGITTVIDMPNTSPPTISTKSLKEKMAIAQRKIVVNTGFYAGIPNTLDEIAQFRNLGIFGFKLYLSHSLGEFDITDPELLRNLLIEIKKIKCPLLIHAERREDIEALLEKIKFKQLSPKEIYLESHSETVEKNAINAIIHLNALIKAKIHLCHVSTAASVEILQKLGKERSNYTAEVTPHHLFLTTEALKKYNAYAKMLPPLRNVKDLAALWRGLNSGIINLVATDHAPHTVKEKEGDFTVAANGIPGFETLLPLLLTAMHQQKIHLLRLIEVCSEEPALFLNLTKKGKIAIGNDADLTIIDLNKETRIKAADFYSKAKFSPFDGKKVKGIATMTVVRGNIIMEDGEIVVQRGAGKIIQRPTE